MPYEMLIVFDRDITENNLVLRVCFLTFKKWGSCITYKKGIKGQWAISEQQTWEVFVWYQS